VQIVRRMTRRREEKLKRAVLLCVSFDGRGERGRS
jgi:hypothetical protein